MKHMNEDEITRLQSIAKNNLSSISTSTYNTYSIAASNLVIIELNLQTLDVLHQILDELKMEENK